jgi:hypothetical protein
MFIVADIIQYHQPEIYQVLLSMIGPSLEYISLEEDETPEFIFYKRLMEERKSVPL